jgi:hypothetical protein
VVVKLSSSNNVGMEYQINDSVTNKFNTDPSRSNCLVKDPSSCSRPAQEQSAEESCARTRVDGVEYGGIGIYQT